jgi:hypothetical protein
MLIVGFGFCSFFVNDSSISSGIILYLLLCYQLLIFYEYLNLFGGNLSGGHSHTRNKLKRTNWKDPKDNDQGNGHRTMIKLPGMLGE